MSSSRNGSNTNDFAWSSYSKVATQPIPEEFDRAIMACLEKDPTRRPASAEVLGKRLQGSLGAMDAWTVDDARVWWTEVRRTSHQPDTRGAEALSSAAG